MKIVSIVGARPEFIQAAPISRALRSKHDEVLVHTGQHYDYAMSQNFFDELKLPAPDYSLEVGSGQHGWQTAAMLMRLEDVLLKEKPDLVIVRGDTNSTLAGALGARQLQIPLAHIEAGERSYCRQMPEELNRVVCDHLADWHFCASHAAVRQLAAEGIANSVRWVGDVMLDALIQYLPMARQRSCILERVDLRPGRYALVTVHRAANTDNPHRLEQIVTALNQLPETIVFPAHPRTRQVLEVLPAQPAAHVKLISPVGYLDMLVLEENARLIATDSGGVQRESYFLGVPCLTLRDETEWIETIQTGWNKLVGIDLGAILSNWFDFTPPVARPPIFGDGTAANCIAQIIGDFFPCRDRLWLSGAAGLISGASPQVIVQ